MIDVVVLGILFVQDGELQSLRDQRVLHSNLLLNSVLLSHDGFIIGKTVNTFRVAAQRLLLLLLRFLRRHL